MKPYRPKHPPWQPIVDQVASRKNKQPDCYGHRNPRGILCRKCAWADTCPVTRGREYPPPKNPEKETP